MNQLPVGKFSFIGANGNWVTWELSPRDYVALYEVAKQRKESGEWSSRLIKEDEE